jgi:hypothetical protein
LSGHVGSVIGGLGGFYEAMTPTMFWLLHAAIATAAGVLAVTLRRPLKGAPGGLSPRAGAN